MVELKQARRAQILQSALRLFLLHGVRGTSMEAIAREAGVAKPTLYKHFDNKDMVFAAVVGGVLSNLRGVAARALTGPGSAADRVSGAFAAKHKLIFNMLKGSPHAAELYAVPKNTNKSALAELENWMLAEAEAAFAQEGRSDAKMLAQLCNACADGVSRHVKHVEEIGPAIRLVVRRLCAA